ncbi:TIGR04282 family arsenosugar biosynthesis glycosyltransferase [Roseovarius albus]|nr:TIGR04282 family arsenosugar biosynthesis glycosyltransferase [Roseovarius albus]
MVKEPRPGRVKTRLGRDIGLTASAWWFRHQVSRLIRELDDPRWHLVLAVAPDHAGMRSRVWPAHLPRIPQGRGDLGQRMARVMRHMPPGPVCVIGADVPDLRAHHITRAFVALGSHDAVFGPAEDGGYWLTGLKRMTSPSPQLFKNVRWSTSHALSDSIVSLGQVKVALTDTLGDVDTLADLKALTARS